MNERTPFDENERLLHDVLTDEAASIHPHDDWDDVVARQQAKAARTSRIRVGVVAGALAVAAAAAIAFPALQADDTVSIDTSPADGADSSSGNPPSTTPSESPTTVECRYSDEGTYEGVDIEVPTCASDAPGEPQPPVRNIDVDAVDLPVGTALPEGAMVVVRTVPSDGTDDGDTQNLEIIDSATGAVVVTLLEEQDLSEGGILDLSLSPDRRTLLYAASTSACGSDIRAMSFDDPSNPTLVAEGDLVEVSPDGSTIAIASDFDCDGHSTITVRPVDGGTALRLGDDSTETLGLPTAGDPENVARVVAMTFADDGRLVYEVRFEDGTSLYEFDVRNAREQRLRPDDNGHFEWVAPASYASGTVLSAQICCAQTNPLESSIVVLRDGAVDDTIVDGIPGAIVLVAAPVGDASGTVAWLDVEGTLASNLPGFTAVDGIAKLVW